MSLDPNPTSRPSHQPAHFPRGFEPAFREMRALGKALDPAAITAIAGRYGVEVDFEATGPII